jgi:hypothetical protein
MQIWRCEGLGRVGSLNSVLYFHYCEQKRKIRDLAGREHAEVSCILHDEGTRGSLNVQPKNRVSTLFHSVHFALLCSALLPTITVRVCFETRPGHPRTMAVGWLRVKEEKLVLSSSLPTSLPSHTVELGSLITAKACRVLLQILRILQCTKRIETSK